MLPMHTWLTVGMIRGHFRMLSLSQYIQYGRGILEAHSPPLASRALHNIPSTIRSMTCDRQALQILIAENNNDFFHNSSGDRKSMGKQVGTFRLNPTSQEILADAMEYKSQCLTTIASQ